MKSYVDTCFLMLEPGRRHLLASGMKFTVIEAVRNELTRLADKDKNVKAAQEALEFHADPCRPLRDVRPHAGGAGHANLSARGLAADGR